jgi:hypothetical protein
MARPAARADDVTMHSYVTEPPTLALAGRSRPQWAVAWAARLGLDTAYLLLGLPAGIIAFSVVVSGWATALGLAITLIGLPIAMATIVVSRGMANAERWRAALVLGAPIRGRYRPVSTGRIVERLKALFADTQTWKDLGWHLLLLPVGVVGFTVAVCCWCWSLWCLTFPIWFKIAPAAADFGSFTLDTWWWAALVLCVGVATLPITVALVRGAAAGTGALARLLLGADTEELEERVEVLTETRAGAVDAAVVALAGQLPDPLLVAVEARRADDLEHARHVLDVGVAVARRPPQQHREGAQPRHSGPAVAGGGHDGGERPHPVRPPDRHGLGDHPAHGGADQVRALDPQLVEQAKGVVGHVLERVVRVPRDAGHRPEHLRLPPVLDVRGVADVAVVEPDDVEALRDEHVAEPLVPQDHL